MTQVNVPVGMSNFVGAGGISVQLPKGSSLATQIDTLSKLPGNEYLVDLAKRSDIDWQQVDVINKTWDHKKEGLTQEAAIIVAIVVTIVTYGAAAEAGASMAVAAGEGTAAVAATATTAAVAGTTTAAGAVIAGATSAAITTLATQATIALINSQGDIGAALKELGSKENVKQLVTAMATAGLVQGLSSAFNLPSGTALAKASFVDKLQTNIINGVASSLVTTAINGGNIEDALKNAVKNAVISTVAAQGANAIGDAKFNGDLDLFSGTLAHAILGCGMGAATTGNSSGCAAGAAGAVIGDLSAEWYGRTFGGNPANAADFAKLTTALVAAAAGGASAMNVAGVTSNNAVTNNYLSHVQLIDRDKELKACQSKNDGACEVNVLKKYEAISAKNTAEIDYNSVLTKGSLETTREGLEKLLNDPSVSAETKQQARKSLNELSVAINVIEKTPNVKDFLFAAGVAIDLGSLGAFAAGRVMNTKLVQEYLLIRGVQATDQQAAAVLNNFYRDGASSTPAGLYTSGGIIPANPNMTTTVLGRYSDDMKSVIEVQMDAVKTADFGARPGGFNVLNVSDTSVNAAGNQFFETVNKPFLDVAIKRGDDVALATIPASKDKIIDPKTGQMLGNYAKELSYLVQNNYKPVNVSLAQWQTIKGWFK